MRALNSVEPAIIPLLIDRHLQRGEEWARLRGPSSVDVARLRLKQLSDWLGDKQWLEGTASPSATC